MQDISSYVNFHKILIISLKYDENYVHTHTQTGSMQQQQDKHLTTCFGGCLDEVIDSRRK